MTNSTVVDPTNSNGEDLTRLPGWRAERSIHGALEDCSLIIATYQRTPDVLKLMSWLDELPDIPSEVVVVDGAPNHLCGEELLKWKNERSLRFDLVYVDSPRGLPRQRNVGIDISRGEFIYFLDDDCLPEPGYFEVVRRVLVDKANDHVGAVDGMVLNEMGLPLPWRWRLRLALRLVGRVEPGVYHPCGTSVPRRMTEPFSGVRPIDLAHGCAMTFRREVLEQERFSEYFQGYAQGEDSEMSLRVRRRWSILWCGDAKAMHYCSPAGRPAAFAKGKMESVNEFFIWKRHSPNPRWVDRCRFWMNRLYSSTLGFTAFLLRPWKYHRFAHASGVAYGAVACIVAPPRYDEPTAKRQYALNDDDRSHQSRMVCQSNERG